MKKIAILLISMVLMSISLNAIITTATMDRTYLVMTDVGLNAAPADAYATSVDAVISDKFPGRYISNKVFTAVATIAEAVNGTSAHHVTPIIQVSGNGVNWADAMTLEAYSSTAVTLAHAWSLVIDLTDIYAPWVRIAYIIHTSAHATLADATTGDIKTQIITTGN